MFKLTKIIATIGPSTDTAEKIETLIQQGVNVFRFNFKHNTLQWHSDRIQLVHDTATKMGMPVGTLLDLQGPEIRINMPKDRIEIEKGELLQFGESIYTTGEKGFSITHPQIIQHLPNGQHVLADDGNFSFVVCRKENDVYLESETTGTLLNHKSLNIPGSDFPVPALIDRDFQGLELAARHEVDFIALSFVRTHEDLATVRHEAKKFHLKGKIIAKIETRPALHHLETIIDAADGIMIARGDLGVEIPVEQVPYYQKMIIRKCMAKGKFVITATQMLQSMVVSPIPTRAEVSDVANAVYDLTDAVMLSGETAQGKYPVKAVDMMRKTVLFHEQKSDDDPRLKIEYANIDTTGIVCDAAYDLYREYVRVGEDVRGFVTFSQTGHTAALISRFRPKVPIFAFTPNIDICESLTLSFGVIPLVYGYKDADEVTMTELKKAVEILSEYDYIREKKGKLIVIHGDHWGRGSGATSIRILDL